MLARIAQVTDKIENQISGSLVKRLKARPY